MESIVLEIPAKVASQLRLPPSRAQKMIMQELVIRLYMEGIISSGQGAYLLKMDRLAFEHFLAEHSVPIHCSPEELSQDISSLEGAL